MKYSRIMWAMSTVAVLGTTVFNAPTAKADTPPVAQPADTNADAPPPIKVGEPVVVKDPIKKK